jgi:hypothetical protein
MSNITFLNLVPLKHTLPESTIASVAIDHQMAVM